ncbi:SigE family RNA polymerase sigma factor [Kitasatospora phosalacinea]|uniref:SigE family RNA polymerase sigma factor n=1 Tax=Kitasatospora phosalacinea TaxID=2065 RepID=UPI0007C7B09C|nr:SigE family RNA polymerase sigma factor [Kitasatospora phosalacinea]
MVVEQGEGAGGRAGQGDGDFREFYEAAYGQLVAHLYALTGDLGEAQDVAQEAFVRAWNHWGRVVAHENPVAWVRLTGQRIAISRWRRARTALQSWIRHGDGQSPVPGPGPETVALVEALRQLPEAQRSALVWHHMGGRSVAEIAADEGVPVGTVKARLHRGRQALAVLLGEEPAAVVEEPVVAPLRPVRAAVADERRGAGEERMPQVGGVEGGPVAVELTGDRVRVAEDCGSRV